MQNETLILVHHKLVDGYWHGNYACRWSDGFESRATITRHHSDNCSPFWVFNESHTDTSGRVWATQNAYCVMDDFGALQEVPQ